MLYMLLDTYTCKIVCCCYCNASVVAVAHIKVVNKLSISFIVHWGELCLGQGVVYKYLSPRQLCACRGRVRRRQQLILNVKGR